MQFKPALFKDQLYLLMEFLERDYFSNLTFPELFGG